MPLSKKAKQELIVAMGSKRDADRLEALMDSNGPIDRTMLRKMEIALGSKKLAAEAKAKIESVAATEVSQALDEGLDVMMGSNDGGEAVEKEIEE
jgi:uncharacterized protein YneF (UPF0154 family)